MFTWKEWESETVYQVLFMQDHLMQTTPLPVFWCARYKGWGCDLFISLAELTDSKGHANTFTQKKTPQNHSETQGLLLHFLMFYDFPLVRAYSVNNSVQNISYRSVRIESENLMAYSHLHVYFENRTQSRKPHWFIHFDLSVCFSCRNRSLAKLWHPEEFVCFWVVISGAESGWGSV